MTCCTAVGEPCANRAVGVEVANAVAFIASLSLEPGEFALKELPSAADRAKGIALDDEDRRVPAISIAASSAHLGL